MDLEKYGLGHLPTGVHKGLGRQSFEAPGDGTMYQIARRYLGARAVYDVIRRDGEVVATAADPEEAYNIIQAR